MAEDPDEVLKRQIAYFASDEMLRERAAPWRDATPEECLAATIESCKEAEMMFAMMEADVRERALQPEPIPEEVLSILESMRHERVR